MREPKTLAVPIGILRRACIAAASGPTDTDPVGCLGGMLMGETTYNLDRPITKTTGGVIARAHRVIARRLRSRSIGTGKDRVPVAGDASGVKSSVDAGAQAADAA